MCSPAHVNCALAPQRPACLRSLAFVDIKTMPRCLLSCLRRCDEDFYRRNSANWHSSYPLPPPFGAELHGQRNGPAPVPQFHTHVRRHTLCLCSSLAPQIRAQPPHRDCHHCLPTLTLHYIFARLDSNSLERSEQFTTRLFGIAWLRPNASSSLG